MANFTDVKFRPSSANLRPRLSAYLQQQPLGSVGLGPNPLGGGE
jgi:hypothetical protein